MTGPLGKAKELAARYEAWRDRNWVRSETRRARQEFETGRILCVEDRNLPVEDRQVCNCEPDWSRRQCGWR